MAGERIYLAVFFTFKSSVMNNEVALAGPKNKVTATFSQNLAWVDKHGNPKTFEALQEFSTTTLTELTGKKVGLWIVGVLGNHIKLERLQGRTGFKLSKPVKMEITVNNRSEQMGYKMTLSYKRIAKLLEKSKLIVAASFAPAPGIGQITDEKVINYLTASDSIVIAPAKKQKQLVNAEGIEPVAEVVE